MRQQCSGVRTCQISFIREHNVSLILQLAIRSHHSIICNYTSGNPHVIWSPARDSNPESSDSQAEPTVFTATYESHPPTKAGNNDVAVPSHTTSDKDDAADKKRKAIEAVSSTPDAQRHKTPDAAPDALHCATKAANNDVAIDNNDAAQLKPPQQATK
jgi:hypothetical protein